MGLSASQARLLSITSRLSDNELRSQTITTAKTSLANETTAASAAYMDALNSTELLYSTYDASGNKVTEKLNGVSLSQYGELKNQYGIINQHGQILVSELDAVNYENSADMYEFLDKYGVLAPEGEGDVVQVKNPQWEVDWEIYNEEYAEWKTQEPDSSLDKYWTEGSNNELYLKFRAASESCYDNAMGGRSGCYLHVLAHLLDLELVDNPSYDPDALYPSRSHIADSSKYPKTYETTVGSEISVENYMIDGAAINSANMSDEMVDVSKAVCAKNNIIYCAENETMKQELLDAANNSSLTEEEFNTILLMNNYYIDENGEAQLKTLKQKSIDLYYVLSNYNTLGLSYNDDCIPLLESFQEDMEYAFKDFNEDLYNQDYNNWLAQEPEKPATPYYIEEEVATILNKDKGQWYINLWHRMNGPSTTKAGTVLEDGTVVAGGKTASGMPLYKVLEDGLMNSPEWLQYALENGTVTLEMVEFAEQTVDDSGLSDCEWTSIVWTNAADITQEQNETAITLAEIQYEQALNDIESKDKQYDNQLKILDTEHNALQTEYDSIKSIIEKTIERNLKLYS